VSYKNDPVLPRMPGVGLVARTEVEPKWHVVVGWIDMIPLVNWKGYGKVPLPGEIVEVVYDPTKWEEAVQ
jgi:hypothetical protein